MIDYLHGECFIFATAVYRLTGWPAIILWRTENEPPVHLVNQLPDGRWFDASGLTSLQQVCQEFGLNKPEYELVEDPDVEYGFVDEPLTEALAAAQQALFLAEVTCGQPYRA